MIRTRILPAMIIMQAPVAMMIVSHIVRRYAVSAAIVRR